MLSPTIPRPERLHHQVFLLAIHDNPLSFLDALDNPPAPQVIARDSTEDDDTYDLPHSLLIRVYLDTIFGDGASSHLSMSKHDNVSAQSSDEEPHSVTLDDLHEYLLQLVAGARAPKDGTAA